MVLPQVFAVPKTWVGRRGYALVRWSDGGPDADKNNRTIHAFRALNHQGRFYNVIANQFQRDRREISTKKSSGRVVSTATWNHRGQSLEYVNGPDRITYPIINMPAVNIPAMKNNTFIPIVAQVPAQAPAPAQAPPVPVQKPSYVISKIPQHAVRALLRDAAMTEEVCAITGEEIDIGNGAVTSCFHLFEKNAIATWLAMPNSRDKCPVCNELCNSYTLDDDGPPPLDMETA